MPSTEIPILTPLNVMPPSEMPTFPHAAALNADYIFEQNLGKGSQGNVWLATRKVDGERVAIKQLNIHSVTTWKQYELFKREAEILESLDIDGVAPFYAYLEDLEAKPPFVCIIQKYIEGQTLAEMLKSKHRFETEAIYDIVAQTLRILEKIHRHTPPVVHRDIKPSNLMLTPTEKGRFQVTLLDFGAVANPQVQNGGSTVAGTFGYMPPEQLMGQAQPASDIYALAAVAVELLSGTSPADIPVCDFKLVIEPYLAHVPALVVQTLHAMLEPALPHRLCNHTALIAQFDALANKTQPSMLAFFRRTVVPTLEQVRSICQPGNYEIWQNFDPQNKISIKTCPCHLSLPQDDDQQHAPSSVLDSIMVILCAILIFAMVFIFDTSTRSIESSPFYPVIYISFLCIITGFVRFVDAKTKQASKREVLSLPETYPEPSENWHHAYKILESSQKIVGKITSIRYQNVDRTYSILHHYKSTNHPQNRIPHVITYDIPQFRVIYSFQYLHNGKLCELYGELKTPVCPEGHYKIGDPITLLVHTQQVNNTLINKSYNFYVMPYPYPFGDVIEEADIVYHMCLKENKDSNLDHTHLIEQQVFKLLSQFDAGDIAAGIQVGDLYVNYFNSHKDAKNIYQMVADRLMTKFQANDINAGIQLVDVYKDKLMERKKSLEVYQRVVKLQSQMTHQK